MSRKRNVYGRKRRINFIPIIILVVAIIILAALIMKIFKKDDYISKIDEVLSSDILKLSGMVNNVSYVDTNVYTKGKIRYTNQHEGTIKLNSFDGTLSEDLDEVGTAKILLEELGKLDEYMAVSQLPKKDNGYYWLDISIVVNNEILIFNDEEDYNFDMYYDKDEQKVYVKEKYYDEFSTKNNKLQLQGYNASENFKNLIEELSVNGQ